MIKNISENAPELGGVIAYLTTAVENTPAVINRPYILGTAVTALQPTAPTKPAKAFVGAGAVVVGVTALGVQQTVHRGRLVFSGFAEPNNNVCNGGIVWCALDLANYDQTAIDGANGSAKLYVDKNGVFSYSATKVADATEVTGGAVVASEIVTTPIQSAIDQTIAVGASTYEFKYAKGLGAIALKIQ